MAETILKQANGLFAVYSSISDALLAYDLTENELICDAMDEAAERARVEMERKIASAPEAMAWVGSLRGHPDAVSRMTEILTTERLPLPRGGF